MGTGTEADRLAIQDVVRRYCDAVTRNDWDAFEDLFVPGAVLALGPPVNMRFEGSRQIRTEMSRMVQGKEVFVQFSYGTIVDIEEAGRARGRTTIQEVTRGEGLEGLTAIGMYFDDFMCEGGVWRFCERRLTMLYMDFTPLTGQATTARENVLID
jgi:hypothetical protein